MSDHTRERDTECCVCYDDLKGETDAMLICKHGLCLDCAATLLKFICPMCRHKITSENSKLSSSDILSRQDDDRERVTRMIHSIMRNNNFRNIVSSVSRGIEGDNIDIGAIMDNIRPDIDELSNVLSSELEDNLPQNNLHQNNLHMISCSNLCRYPVIPTVMFACIISSVLIGITSYFEIY